MVSVCSPMPECAFVRSGGRFSLEHGLVGCAVLLLTHRSGRTYCYCKWVCPWAVTCTCCNLQAGWGLCSPAHQRCMHACMVKQTRAERTALLYGHQVWSNAARMHLRCCAARVCCSPVLVCVTVCLRVLCVVLTGSCTTMISRCGACQCP